MSRKRGVSLDDNVKPYRPRLARVKAAGKVVVVAGVLAGGGYGGYVGYEKLTYSPPPPPPIAAVHTSFVGGAQQDALNVVVSNTTSLPERVTAVLQRYDKFGQFHGFQATVADGEPGQTSPGSDTVTFDVPAHGTVRTQVVGPAADLQFGGTLSVTVNGRAENTLNF